jgi:hypothetical protein
MLKGMSKAFLSGARAFFRDTASLNNFLLLSLTYFIGVGLSSLLIKLADASKRKAPGTAAGDGNNAVTHAGGHAAGPASYWRDLDTGKKEADAFYRPF